jgi:hypothetical protein
MPTYEVKLLTMAEGRLPTDLWVKAHVKLCSAEGVPVIVARRGDPHSGIVILKLNQLDLGCRVMSQMRDLDGKLGWLEALEGALVPEVEADAYIARQAERDPDLWVMEVEDRLGRHWVDGAVI